MIELKGKTLLVTGASRGIGKAIALRAARDGANVVVAAKTSVEHPRLPGTIHTAAAEIEAAGGRALACVVDVRFEDQIQKAVQLAVQAFGGIDILVNNAGAIRLTGTADTPLKQFDLMHQVNVRAAFACTQACLPHLRRSANPHILNLCPPLHLEAKWFAPHLAYTLSKYGMTLCVLGQAQEFRADGIAVNALWPRSIIATAAVRNLLGGEAAIQRARRPEIMAEAAWHILRRPSRECTGNFFLDEEVLRAVGMRDFESFAVSPGQELLPDLFVG
jgi:citronellol/citronellal dehydrogenase